MIFRKIPLSPFFTLNRQISMSARCFDKRPHQHYVDVDHNRSDYPPIPKETLNDKNEPYRKLTLFPPKFRKYDQKPQNSIEFQKMAPRWTRMSPVQDWSSVWPTAHTFKASVVPLPIRMGFLKTKHLHKRLPPAKQANLELMKIPNFLHLTPPAIKKHCEAIKKFCTAWPEELTTKEDIERHFPIEVTTCDYVIGGPSIRDPRSRIVITKLSLAALKLDTHARYKFITLCGLERYDKTTNTLTLVTDRCPARHQNRDYAMYLITALYFQCWKVEAWESEIQEENRVEYFWDGTKSKQAVYAYLKALAQVSASDDQNAFAPQYLKNQKKSLTFDDYLDKTPEIQNHATVMKQYFNDGETEQVVRQYAESMMSLLNVPRLEEISV